MKLETRNCIREIQTRDATEESEDSIGTLFGYCAVFDTDSPDIGYIEQIRKGAFADAIEKNDVVALINHNHDKIVGRLSAGTLTLSETDLGLYYEIKLPNTIEAQSLKTSVKRGDLKGCSFGFYIDDCEWSTRDDEDFCVLTKIDLFEISTGVTFPCYSETTIDIRSHQSRKAKALAKLKLRTI